MASESISILVVEDEPAIAELVSFSVKTAGWTPVTVYSGTEAWTALQRFRPDVVLLDWMLPDLSGIHLLNRIREHKDVRTLPVIMLTAKTLEEDKVAGLDQGADDYMTKPFSPKELVARINALLRRKAPERAKSLLRAGAVTLNPENCQVRIGNADVEIGNSEFRLLKFLMANPDRVFSRGQLLDKVWSDQLDIEERTVDVHVLRLRKALKGQEGLIRTVRGMGYMLSEKDKSE